MITQITGAILIVLASFAPWTINPYEVGDTVATFSLPGVQGKTVSLMDYSGKKGVILIFDCNTCPYSQAYRDRIKELHKNYTAVGFPVLAINPNDPNRQPGDSFEAMKTYASEHNYKHQYVQDVDQSVARAFGATNTPQVFLLENVDNSFVLRYIGAIDNNTRSAVQADNKYVESAIQALIAGKQPPTAKTKAIGCTIKWKAS